MDITQKIDAVTKIDETRISMGGIQLPPKSVKIELTARCNLRCKFCAVGMRTTKPPKDMDFYFFQRITEDMRISGVEEIGLFYLGESFMNPQLLCGATDWVKNKLKFPYVFLTTNATLADPDWVRKLMELGLDSLKWSANYENEEQFQAITGVSPIVYHKALSNIKKAWDVRNEGKFKTMLSASSIVANSDQKLDLEDFLNKDIRPYVDKHYFLPLYQMGMNREHVIKTMGYVPSAGNVGRLDEVTLLPLRKALPCWGVFTEGHVRADGGLSACCFGSDSRFDMGILDGTNFMRMWNSKKFVALRDAQLRTLTEGQDALKGTPCAVCVAYE
jgi:uncharacterized Fe-S cluster-containing radical SAM superfamily protein